MQLSTCDFVCNYKATMCIIWWVKNKGVLILTGLTVSRSWTSSTTRFVERRKGNLDSVSSLVICASCSSSFLLSHKNNATRTMMPVDCWFKTLVILEQSCKGQSIIIFSALIIYTSEQKKRTNLKDLKLMKDKGTSNIGCSISSSFPEIRGITSTFNSTKKPWNGKQQWNPCSCWECHIKESPNTTKWSLDLTNKFEISTKTIAYVFST